MTGTFALYWRGSWSFFCVIICIISLGGTALRRKQNLFPSQNSIQGTKKEPARTLACLWSGWRESNPPVQLGKLAFYRWTTPAYSCIDNTILSALFPVLAKSYLGKRLVKSPATKKELWRNESSFLHSPFLLCFHLVQGSGFRWRLRRLF